MERAGKYFVLVSNILLLVLWAYTSVSKFLGQQIFVTQLKLSPVAQLQGMAGFLGWFIPAGEILTAFFLLTDRFKLLGFYCSLILLAAFESYIVLVLSSGKHLPCSCGGVIAKMSWQEHVVFNAIFIIMTVTAMFLYRRNDEPKMKVRHI